MGVSESQNSDDADAPDKGRGTTDRGPRRFVRNSPLLVHRRLTRPWGPEPVSDKKNVYADLRRERRLRQQAITERVNAMKANIAQDLAVQHELTLDALENELRSDMEAELETMQRDALPQKKQGFVRSSTCDLNANSKHPRPAWCGATPAT